jgi:hypothetical protein
MAAGVGRSIVRGAGLLLALGLSVAAVLLILFGADTKAVRVGVILGAWGLMFGGLSFYGPRRGGATSAVPTTDGSPGTALAVRSHGGAVELASDSQGRRDFETMLQLMLRRELERGVRGELDVLREEVAGLRGEVSDAMRNQVSLERVETRVVGANLAELQDEMRRRSSNGDSIAALVAAPPAGAAAESVGASTGRSQPAGWSPGDDVTEVIASAADSGRLPVGGPRPFPGQPVPSAPVSSSPSVPPRPMSGQPHEPGWSAVTSVSTAERPAEELPRRQRASPAPSVGPIPTPAPAAVSSGPLPWPPPAAPSFPSAPAAEPMAPQFRPLPAWPPESPAPFRPADPPIQRAPDWPPASMAPPAPVYQAPAAASSALPRYGPDSAGQSRPRRDVAEPRRPLGPAPGYPTPSWLTAPAASPGFSASPRAEEKPLSTVPPPEHRPPPPPDDLHWPWLDEAGRAEPPQQPAAPPPAPRQAQPPAAAQVQSRPAPPAQAPAQSPATQPAAGQPPVPARPAAAGPSPFTRADPFAGLPRLTPVDELDLPELLPDMPAPEQPQSGQQYGQPQYGDQYGQPQYGSQYGQPQKSQQPAAQQPAYGQPALVREPARHGEPAEPAVPAKADPYVGRRRRT